MSFEYAANPNKMAPYLSSFNSANLGEVSYEGVMQDAYDDVAATRRNLAAEDTVSRLENEAEKAKMGIAYKNEIGAMEMDARRNDAWIGAGLNVAGAGIKKSGFSLFGNGDGIGDITSDTGIYTTGKASNVIQDPSESFRRLGYNVP